MTYTGTIVGGPLCGKRLTHQTTRYEVARPGDVPAEDFWAGRNPMNESVEVFVYRHHEMAVADGGTYQDSDKHFFWVPLDEKQPNKLIVNTLLAAQHDRWTWRKLASRAYKVIDWLMPGLRDISIPDYGELNDVCLELARFGRKGD